LAQTVRRCMWPMWSGALRAALGFKGRIRIHGGNLPNAHRQ
jgi:hypothetical protein